MATSMCGLSKSPPSSVWPERCSSSPCLAVPLDELSLHCGLSSVRRAAELVFPILVLMFLPEALDLWCQPAHCWRGQKEGGGFLLAGSFPAFLQSLPSLRGPAVFKIKGLRKRGTRAPQTVLPGSPGLSSAQYSTFVSPSFAVAELENSDLQPCWVLVRVQSSHTSTHAILLLILLLFKMGWVAEVPCSLEDWG